MVGLKRTEKLSRTLKIYLNDRLEMDSNDVDYNLRGTVIYRDFVEYVEVEHTIFKSDTDVLRLPPDVHVDEEIIVVAQNTGEDCLKLFKTAKEHGHDKFMLLPIKHIEKIKLTESVEVTLVP